MEECANINHMLLFKMPFIKFYILKCPDQSLACSSFATIVVFCRLLAVPSENNPRIEKRLAPHSRLEDKIPTKHKPAPSTINKQTCVIKNPSMHRAEDGTPAEFPAVGAKCDTRDATLVLKVEFIEP